MDITESENISKTIEENIHLLKDGAENMITNDSSEDVESELGNLGELEKTIVESACEESAERKILNETSTKQKESIEILKVELVVPGREDPVADTSTDENNMVYVENSVVIESEQDVTGTDIEEIAAEIQTNEETTLHDITLITQRENEEILNNNLDSTITGDSGQPGSILPSSLSLLTQYNSDDDSDSVIEVPTTSAQDYRGQVVEINSEDSTDSSDVDYLSELRRTIEKRTEVADEGEDEDDNEDNTGKKRHQAKLKVKGEMSLEDLPPIQELHITVPEDECIEFGKIHSIVDQLILVSVLPNSILLDLETIIFLEKGQKVLGEVFDVLGQVADPLYCVRFNSNDQIKERQINIGDVVYVAPKTQYTQYVILSNLMRLKGSDASWENDVEPPPRFLDYSDDEQEQLARRKLRNKDRPIDSEDPKKKPRTVDAEDDSTPTRNNTNNVHHRSNYNEQRNNRGGLAGYSNVSTRPRYSGSPQNQQRVPNHHRNSWHSNYYPQCFPSHPTGNYGMRSMLHQPQSSPNAPASTMPPMHNMPPYPPTQPMQYVAPPMFHPHPPHVMPNSYSVRPPTLHGPPHIPQHQYSSNPPPPGSQ